MTTPSGSSSTTQTLKNVIVGVTTTVLASTIVYFLGFHKSGRSTEASMLFAKEATTRAWTDYVSYENSFTKNWKTLGAGYNVARFKNYKEETLDEFNKFFNDIKTLMETKDIDPGFSSLLKRRLKAREKWESKYKIHLDNYESILNNSPEQERNQKLNDEVARFQTDVKDLDDRFVNEIDDVAKALSDKYHYKFSLSELVMFQQAENNTKAKGSAGIDQQMLTGQWKVSDAAAANTGTLYQYSDGRMYYYFTSGDSTYGRWQLNDNQLTLHYDQYWGAGNKFTYNVSGLTNNSYTITLASSPFNSFYLTRTN
jgi:hypothetical protein